MRSCRTGCDRRLAGDNGVWRVPGLWRWPAVRANARAALDFR
jgi:hypothetical protein